MVFRKVRKRLSFQTDRDANYAFGGLKWK